MGGLCNWYGLQRVATRESKMAGLPNPGAPVARGASSTHSGGACPFLTKLCLIIQVHYKGKLGVLDLAHPALNLMSYVPLEVD